MATQRVRLNPQGEAGKGGAVGFFFEKPNNIFCHRLKYERKLTGVVAIIRHGITETLIGHHT
jgi:hypothetical protein